MAFGRSSYSLGGEVSRLIWVPRRVNHRLGQGQLPRASPKIHSLLASSASAGCGSAFDVFEAAHHPAGDGFSPPASEEPVERGVRVAVPDGFVRARQVVVPSRPSRRDRPLWSQAGLCGRHLLFSGYWSTRASSVEAKGIARGGAGQRRTRPGSPPPGRRSRPEPRRRTERVLLAERRRVTTRQRERRAGVRWKEGFSVVVPKSTTEPSSR